MQSPQSGGVRFAPSPTGNLHVGNFRTAWISHKLAKAFNLPWVVRFEDIDRPRVVEEARSNQLKDLANLGLLPDVELLQSQFRNRHWQIFIDGIRQRKIYPCDCSRKEVQQALASMASAPHLSPITYSGHCRNLGDRKFVASETLAWRFKMDDSSGQDDFIVARTSKDFDKNGVPDFTSFTPSYHLACAIDDHDGNYDLLVRSCDLRESLHPQREIQKWMGRTNFIPVFHTSLVTQDDGKRLEKRTLGVTLQEMEARNINPPDLIKIFEKSFELPSSIQRTDPKFGEKKEKISLSQLGI